MNDNNNLKNTNLNESQETKGRLSMGSLIIMNIVAVVSLRGLPAEAEYGMSSIFYYIFAAVFFLIPVSLVAAELATGWPEKGGVFRWVGEAFGPKLAFLAMFLLWAEVTIWFPTALTFGAVSLAFIGPDQAADQALSSNKLFVLAIVLLIYWGATYISTKGVSFFSKVAKWGGIIGTIIPAVILVVLGFAYVFSGETPQIEVSFKDIWPDFTKFDNFVLAASIFLFYAGMEMNAIHVKEVDNPKRNYPIAIMAAALGTVSIFVLGTLAIAFVIPQKDISLTQSLLVTYFKMFQWAGIPWMAPVIAVALAASIFLFYAGMEMNAIHVKEVDNPKRNYPIAIMAAALGTVSIFVLGTLAIAFVIPQKDISLTQSLLVTYFKMFQWAGIPWMAPVIAVALAIGVLAGIVTWVSGPSTGMLSIAKAGYLPRWWHHTNKNGVATHIMFVQGVVVSVLSISFVVLPSVEAAYQILSQLTTILYLIMYLLMFAAAIYLRYSQPNRPRAYRIPGKDDSGMWIIGGAGFIGSSIALIFSFIPPGQIQVGSPQMYVGLLIVLMLVFCSIPFIIYRMKKDHWRDENADFAPFTWEIEGGHPGIPTSSNKHMDKLVEEYFEKKADYYQKKEEYYKEKEESYREKEEKMKAKLAAGGDGDGDDKGSQN